ncbi:MAG: methyl-accepting chemotaxis protein [Thermodesulfovibrio sp.]|uniref:methyl-accepting chemotaxis protein n=1 Tax=Thermodesulfovibrio sp. 1176 TaxID=3043424 RepID=UPI0024824DFC|nr:methyl-accepting chemotaxis protein [Thermodesulfovibrio sp. 1176]MDI1472575.1 methyl-accepting chemotaxis protein [Thermodesulfovibrio sp. 1176]MDI6714381.1 methyl-accepting chemotaxis protein [Thermodesulfovibrio sp.]
MFFRKKKNTNLTKKDVDTNLSLIKTLSSGIIKSNIVGSTISNTMGLIDSNFSRIKDEVSSIATAMEEIDTTIRDMSKSVVSINNEVQALVKQNETMDEELEKKVKEIESHNEKIIEVVTNIKDLGDATKNIGNIVTAISDVADQTNLLALNASIEAARVGEAGRGFAVVADEIRKLAQKTDVLTKDIGKILGNLSERVIIAVKEVEKIKELFSEIEEEMKTIRISFEKNKTMSDTVGDAVNTLSTAIEEQSQVLTDVSKRITNTASMLNETYKVFSTVVKVNDEIAKITKF